MLYQYQKVYTQLIAYKLQLIKFKSDPRGNSSWAVFFDQNKIPEWIYLTLGFTEYYLFNFCSLNWFRFCWVGIRFAQVLVKNSSLKW